MENKKGEEQQNKIKTINRQRIAQGKQLLAQPVQSDWWLNDSCENILLLNQTKNAQFSNDQNQSNDLLS